MSVLQTLNKGYKMQLCIKVMYRVPHQALKSTSASHTHQILGFKRRKTKILCMNSRLEYKQQDNFWNLPVFPKAF